MMPCGCLRTIYAVAPFNDVQIKFEDTLFRKLPLKKICVCSLPPLTEKATLLGKIKVFGELLGYGGGSPLKAGHRRYPAVRVIIALRLSLFLALLHGLVPGLFDRFPIKTVMLKESGILTRQHGPLQMGRDLLDRRPDHVFLGFHTCRTCLRDPVLDQRRRHRVFGLQRRDPRKGDHLIRQPYADGAKEDQKQNLCPIPHNLWVRPRGASAI